MTEHNYAEKTADELDELADYYFRLHGEAREAFDANGRNAGGYWDQAMQEYMDELRAIDRAKQAKTTETAEAGEVAL